MKAKEFSAANAFQSEYHRQDLSRKIKELFARFDGLLVPTTPTFPSIESSKWTRLGKTVD
jgi:urea carboxylase/allophanate hydrolase